MDCGYVGCFKALQEVGGRDDVIHHFEDDGEGRVAQVFYEPFFPSIRTWCGPGVSFS